MKYNNNNENNNNNDNKVEVFKTGNICNLIGGHL